MRVLGLIACSVVFLTGFSVFGELPSELSGSNIGKNNYSTSSINAKNIIEAIDEPDIVVTYVPKYGTEGFIEGKTFNVPPRDHRVVVYAYSCNEWKSKPSVYSSLRIYDDGRWLCNVASEECDKYARKYRVILTYLWVSPPGDMENFLEDTIVDEIIIYRNP